MIDQRPSDALASGSLDRVHRLQLAVRSIELPESPDSEELAVEAGAIERDGRAEKPVDVQREDAFGRRDVSIERQMPLQQGANVVTAGIVDGDDKSHGGRLPTPN